jgi:hypothetical protein
MRKLFLVLSVAALLVACLVPSVANAATVKYHDAFNQRAFSDGYLKVSFMSDATKWTANGMYHDSFTGKSVGRTTTLATPTYITLAEEWSWVTSSTTKTVTKGVDVSLGNISGNYGTAVTTIPNIAYITWSGTSTAPTKLVSHSFDGVCLKSLKSISSEEMSCTASFFFAPGTWIDVTAIA